MLYFSQAAVRKTDGAVIGGDQRDRAEASCFRPQAVKKGESAIRKTKKAEAGYQSVFARTCASQTHLIGEK